MKTKPVEDISITKKLSSNKLIKELYKSGGFTAKKIAHGVDILEKIIN